MKPSRKRQSSGKCGGHYHPDKHLKYPAKTEVQDLSDTQSLEDNTRSTFLEKTTDTLADNPSIYKLQFVSYPDRNNKNFMTDLRSFKQSLMIYPIIKVTQ